MISVDSELETVQGEITSVLHQHKDSYVVRMRTVEEKNVTVLIGYGILTGPRLYEGESICAKGVYEYSFSHGDQFQCESVRRLPLSEAHLIVQWLAKNKDIQGVGAQTGKKLIATFKNKLVEVLNKGDIEEISTEAEIAPAKILTLVMAWKMYKGEMASVDYLIDLKFPYQLAMNCIGAWGDKVESMLNFNPYYLSAFWGFNKVDSFVCTRWNIENHDHRRVTAFAEDVLLSRYKYAGDTAMTASDLSLKMREGLGLDVTAIPSEQDLITINEHGDYQAAGPFVMEQYVRRRLEAIRDVKCKFKRKFDQKKLAEYESTLPFKLNPKQKDAVKCSVTNPVSIIRGGAGTGKTTVLEAILAQYRGFQRQVILLAPTGKAALRMTEATGYDAKTIAKFISEVLKNEGADTFHGSVVVVDETSMVDLPTIYSLLSKLPNDINLIFVGDERQLAPVGPGLFFHLIVKDKCWIPQVKLNKAERYDSASGIPAVADSILAYKAPNMAPMQKLMKQGCAFREISDAETCFENAAKLYAKLRSLDEDVQLILATRSGVAKLNNLAQHLVNPLNKEKYKTHSIEHANGSRFIAGDKVVYNENDYRKGLTNGALGTVIEVYPEPQLSTVEGVEVTHVMRVRFDDLISDEMYRGAADIYITDDEFSDEKLSLAYAITCHKSQGSQYNSVIIILDSDRLAENSWIYTAITRAKNSCYVLGKETRLIKASTTQSKAAQRLTGFMYE